MSLYNENHIKSKKMIDKAGERLRKESIRDDVDVGIVQSFRGFRATNFDKKLNEIIEALKDRSFIVAGRLKRVDSIIRKLIRQSLKRNEKNSSTPTLVRMSDIVAYRIITDTPLEQKEIIKDLSALTKIKIDKLEYKDKDDGTKDIGYRAVHMILKESLSLPNQNLATDYPIEVQIRTWYQHLWATYSESFGEQVKEGGGSRKVREKLQDLSLRIKVFEQENPITPQLGFPEVNKTKNYASGIINFEISSKNIIEEERFFRHEEAIAYLNNIEYQLKQEGVSDLYESVLLLYFLHEASNSKSILEYTHLKYFPEALGCQIEQLLKIV